jgi:pimeloyl-ACP methyl ester carboxylesterase
MSDAPATDVPLLPDLPTWRAGGRLVPVLGHDVFVVEAGPVDAPPLVYLHGYPSSCHDLAPVLGALSQRYRVIAHDHLGFGLSAKPADYSYSLLEQAEVALALWRSLGVMSAHVVAHDYGTSVATEILARRERVGVPLDLRSLTLCNGSVHIELADLRVIQVLLRNQTVGPLVARLSTRGIFAHNMRRILADPATLSDADVDTMYALLNENGGRERISAITGYLDERRRFWHRWIGALTRLDLPAHVLWGTEDPVAVRAIADRLAGEIPGARLSWLDGVGHYPMLEAPARWADGVLGFLDDVELSSRA